MARLRILWLNCNSGIFLDLGPLLVFFYLFIYFLTVRFVFVQHTQSLAEQAVGCRHSSASRREASLSRAPACSRPGSIQTSVHSSRQTKKVEGHLVWVLCRLLSAYFNVVVLKMTDSSPFPCAICRKPLGILTHSPHSLTDFLTAIFTFLLTPSGSSAMCSPLPSRFSFSPSLSFCPPLFPPHVCSLAFFPPPRGDFRELECLSFFLLLLFNLLAACLCLIS